MRRGYKVSWNRRIMYPLSMLRMSMVFTYILYRSHIAHPVSSWLDDYVAWLRPEGMGSCCRLHKNGKFCPQSGILMITCWKNEIIRIQIFCILEKNSSGCEPCDVNFYRSRPDEVAFYEHIQSYLQDNPNMKCAKGGHAAYGNALHFANGPQMIDGEKTISIK